MFEPKRVDQTFRLLTGCVLTPTNYTYLGSLSEAHRDQWCNSSDGILATEKVILKKGSKRKAADIILNRII